MNPFDHRTLISATLVLFLVIVLLALSEWGRQSRQPAIEVGQNPGTLSLAPAPSPTPLQLWVDDDSAYVFNGSHDLTLDVMSDLTFSCGDGSITLSLKDGSVTYDNCDPTESGKAFWRAVTKAFPEVREAIRKGEKP